MVELSKHIDWFSLMSYDINGPWDSVAGANADMVYINNTVSYMLQHGVLPEKIVFGMAAYGRSTRLLDPSCTTDGCPIGGAGKCTILGITYDQQIVFNDIMFPMKGLWGCQDAHGVLPFFEIDEFYSQPGGHESSVLNKTTGSMELVSHGSEFFVSFDNKETFNIKYRYAYDHCMRGVMWYVSLILVHCNNATTKFIYT